MINYTKYVLRETPVKEKGRVGGEPSDYDSSQNLMKQRGRKEDWERVRLL